MKVHIIFFMCLVFILSSVQSDEVWSGKKCGIDSQKLYDQSLGIATCSEYCAYVMTGTRTWGSCKLNAGYGECYCGSV